MLAGALAGAMTCSAATLAISTYLRDGFTPSAIASDTQGNLYLAGSTVLDPAGSSTGAVLMKLDPKASQCLYLVYFDSAASDHVSAIAADKAGNLYATGWTTNSNFPVTPGGQLGTPPTNAQDQRSFVIKLSPNGAVVFAVLVGGSAGSTAEAIALTPQGQILISGETASGFPLTPGAYRVADSKGHLFLMELDATASNVIFSATGIGGTSIALDPAGNIFVAGSDAGTDYPTTPGAYQTQFVQGGVCYTSCGPPPNGVLQHLTKVDPTGSTLIYSTGINDVTGAAGDTTNTGLAVDDAGNAYVTGTLIQAQYPFTVPVPNIYTSFLTKLDPSGASVIFSVPIGGAGVQLDASGGLYVGGVVQFPPAVDLEPPPTSPLSPPAVLSWIPQVCWPNFMTTNSGAYVMKIDPATGNAVDAQWIDGSGPGATAITLSSGKVWITGPTPAPDVPFTPGVLSPSKLGPGFLPGAYLAAAVFFASSGAAPVIACVLDGGNLTHAGAVAAFQLISLFGKNLGPSVGVGAPHGSAASIAGVTVTFDGNLAQLLYVSSSQINVAVPARLPPLPSSTVMQVSVNGATVQRQFPFALANLNLFAYLLAYGLPCPAAPVFLNGLQPVATNADGSLNSCAKPAKFGSTVSFYAEGVGQLGFAPPLSLGDIQAQVGNCPAEVEDASLINSFVYKVDVLLPSTLLPCAAVHDNFSPVDIFGMTLTYGGSPVAPLLPYASPAQSLPMNVWATQ